MNKSLQRADDFPRDIDELFGPGARLKPRAKTPVRVEDSKGFKPTDNDKTVDLAEAYRNHFDQAMKASRPLREALVNRLRLKPLVP